MIRLDLQHMKNYNALSPKAFISKLSLTLDEERRTERAADLNTTPHGILNHRGEHTVLNINNISV